MRRFHVSLLALALAAPVYAADVSIAGADRPVKHYAKLTVTAEAGDQVAWTVLPAPEQRDIFGGVLVFAGKAGKTYAVAVTVVNFDKKKLDQGTVEVFFEGTPEPIPPPKPKPDDPTPKPPEPTPGTSPFPDPGLKVLIVIPKEGAELSQNQFDIIYGADARAFLDTTVGNANYRIYPVTTQVEGAPKAWKDAFMRKRGPPPWVLVGNGKTGYEGEMPKDMTVEQFKALVNKYK